jgi:hypothetical protein
LPALGRRSEVSKLGTEKYFTNPHVPWPIHVWEGEMQQTPNTAPDYSEPVDATAELGIQLSQRGQPALADHVPKRFVPLKEAQARGWSMFWDGRACRYGHQAARKVSNLRWCSDCERVKAGRTAIYPTSKAQSYYEQPRRKPRDASTPLVIQAPAPKPPEPDATDKAFLAKYAELRDIEAAAKVCGTTAAQIVSRRSHNALLDGAMTRIETDLTIPKLVPESPAFDWTDEKRERLLEVYVDSGNLAIARDAIKCTPSQLWRELDTNAPFASALEDARVRAAQVFEERAHAEALNGNDRLLPIVLKAERPDKYTEKLRLDVHTKYDRMTPNELNAELSRLFEELADLGDAEFNVNVVRLFGGRVIDGQVTEVTTTVKPAQLPAPESGDDDGSNNGGEDPV